MNGHAMWSPYGAVGPRVPIATRRNPLALPLWLEKRGGSFATTIQLVEADRLCNPDGKPDSKSLRGGIEIDSYGAAKAYWIRKNHPGDYLLSAGSEKDWQRIPVETPFGRRRVLHIADLERSGQSRGVAGGGGQRHDRGLYRNSARRRGHRRDVRRRRGRLHRRPQRMENAPARGRHYSGVPRRQGLALHAKPPQ